MFRLFFLLMISSSVLLLDACSEGNQVTFKINGTSQLVLPSGFLVNANISPLDDFSIHTSTNDTIHISTLMSSTLGFGAVDLRNFPKYMFGEDVKFENSEYGKELKKASEVHAKLYKKDNDRKVVKGPLILYFSRNDKSAVIYIAHNEITNQITMINLKSNEINKLIDIVEQGISYNGTER